MQRDHSTTRSTPTRTCRDCEGRGEVWAAVEHHSFSGCRKPGAEPLVIDEWIVCETCGGIGEVVVDNLLEPVINVLADINGIHQELV